MSYHSGVIVLLVSNRARLILRQASQEGVFKALQIQAKTLLETNQKIVFLSSYLVTVNFHDWCPDPISASHIANLPVVA